MSLTTKIEKTERVKLKKRCWFSPNWNTIRLLDHNWRCRTCNRTVHSTTVFSPFEIVYGFNPPTPMNLIPLPFEERVSLEGETTP